MFCPERIPSLSFTPVIAGVIFIPDLIVLQSVILRTRPQNRIFTPLKKGISRRRSEFSLAGKIKKNEMDRSLICPSHLRKKKKRLS
jgi:hypothetical protein